MTDPVTDPASTFSDSLIGDDPKRSSNSSGRPWFRTREGRQYALEIALIVVVKLALLVLLWFAFIKPWPRPAVPPASVVEHFYIPSAPVIRHD